MMRACLLRSVRLWVFVGVAAAAAGCFVAAPPSGQTNGNTASSGNPGTGPAAQGNDAGASGSSSGSAPSEEASTPGVVGYTVMGAFIYDASGNKHLFRGVDRPSFEWSAQGVNPSQSDFDTMKAWGANVVRIPLNQTFWINDPANSNYDSAYESNIDSEVQGAESDGLDVILDLHWSDGGSFSNTAAQWCMADQQSITFWQDVATKYKNDPHVLFELYNEPYVTDWGIWQNGGMTTCSSVSNGSGQRMSATFQVAGMQQLYDTVRATGAQNLVIIGGLNYAFDLSQVKSHRIVDGSGNPAPNVIYNTHPYNQGGKTTPAEWYNAFGYLAATDPVIATEFGDGNSSTCNTGQYDSSIIPYFDDQGASNNPANPISWTAWAFYPGGCGFPSLISDWQYTPTASGTVVKAALQAFKQP